MGLELPPLQKAAFLKQKLLFFSAFPRQHNTQPYIENICQMSILEGNLLKGNLNTWALFEMELFFGFFGEDMER